MANRPSIDMPDLDSMTDEEFNEFVKSMESRTLMASDDMAELMMDTVHIIRKEQVINDLLQPIYGLLTLKARHTAFYVFNHPKLKEKFDKGFNDGHNVFINEDWMRKLDEEERKNPHQSGIIPYLLHHLTHMIMNHHRRFKQYPPEFVQMVTDLWIQARLDAAFPDVQWVDVLKNEYLGAKLSMKEKIELAKKSEDTLLMDLWLRYKHLYEKNEDNPSSSNHSTDENESDSNQDQDSPTASENQSESQNQKKTSQMDVKALQKALKSMGIQASQEKIQEQLEDNDTLTLEENIKNLEESGLDVTLERLDYPTTDNEDALDKIEEFTQLKNIEDIQKNLKIQGEKGARGDAGLGEAAYEEAKKLTEGKLSWQLGVQEMLGESMNYAYSEAEPGDLYYVNPEDMGLDIELFIGTDLPHKKESAVVVLMDTSGSITEDMFSMFLAEIHGLLKNQNPGSETATEVYLIFADTIMQNNPILLTPETIDEILEDPMAMIGRGGTDISGSLRQLKKSDFLKEKKIHGIVYLTDLEDSPPQKKDIPEFIPLIFVAPETVGQEEFIRATKDFCRVYKIEEGLEIDLKTPTMQSKPLFK